MLEYRHDGEKAKHIPEQMVVDWHLVGEESQLGSLVGDYLHDTVTKILLAKNKALLNNASKQPTGEILENTPDDDSKTDLDENYLENLVIKNKNGEIITSPDEMSQWVTDNFYFCLEDQNAPNAWIMARNAGDEQKSVIAVTKKMIEMSDNDAQFEGIIAHELGHYFVQKRYGEKRARSAGALNEKMADMHASDCLVYLGKNPEEYEIIFQKLSGMYDIADPVEKLITSVADEHGGNASRIHDIADYNEVAYHNYLEDYYQKEESESDKSPLPSDDSCLFTQFKQQFEEFYDAGQYLSFIEGEFIKDDKFAYALNQQSERIDFTQIKYEDALDKLTEIAQNENLRFDRDIYDAAQVLQQSLKDGLEFTPELERKATLFMSQATDSVYMNRIRQNNEKSDKTNEKEAQQHILKIIESLNKQENIPNTVENEIIAEEFRRTGAVLTPKDVGERIKQLPSESRFSYNGKEVVRSRDTYIFTMCARTDKEKESDAKTPSRVYFYHDSVIQRKESDTLVNAIILEAYEKDGTVLTAKEVADKLDEALKGVEDVWGKDKQINYNGKNVFISPYQSKQYLQIFRPQSAALSEQDRLERADYLYADEVSNISSDTTDAIDSLLMAVSYPDIDFTKFKEAYNNATPAQKTNLEIDLSRQILSAKTIKVQPFSYLRNRANNMQEFINGLSPSLGSSSSDWPTYSRFAIGIPTFEMPTEKNAKGQELPWLKAESDGLKYFGLSVTEGKSVAEAEAKDFLFNTPENLFAGRLYSPITLINFPQNKPYQIMADENGKIIATGAEAAHQLGEKKRTDSLNEAMQVSETFRERVKVLDALICLTELKNKEKTEQLSLPEQQRQKEALHYLLTTENLETSMLQLSSVIPDDYGNARQRQKELSYNNMPVVQTELIMNDLAFLKQSDFYKKFIEGQDIAESPEKLVGFMEDMVSWKVGEKTPELLQTIVPPLYSVLEVRRQNLEGSKKLYSKDGRLEQDLLQNVTLACAKQDMSEKDEQNILALELSLKAKQDKSTTSLLDFSSYYTVGVEGDSTLYVKGQNPYYERMRHIFNMPETAGSPEQLYQNLAAVFNEDDLIKNPEHKDNILRRYDNGFSAQEKDLDKVRQFAAAKKEYVLDANMPKLQVNWVKGIYKLAEYETARYLNNQENQDIDVVKLLKAYPKYEHDIHEKAICSPDFQDLLATHILEKSNFKEMDFYAQKEIYDLMLHKELFNRETEAKALFAEELKKSYERLPEAEKEKAALSMLQDNTLSFTTYRRDGMSLNQDIYSKAEDVSTVTSVDIFPLKQYFTEAYAEKFVERVGKEPIEGDMLPTGKIATKEDVAAYHAEINAFVDNIKQTTKTADVKEHLFALVADGIESQPQLTEVFEQAVKHQDNERDLSLKNEFKVRGLNGFNQLLNMSPNANLDMIAFFTEPYSDNAVEKLRSNLPHSSIMDLKKILTRLGEDTNNVENIVKNEIKQFSKEDLHNMYDEFWNLTVEERAVIMQRFLNNATQDDNSKAIDICLDKYIDRDNPYYGICKEVLNTLYKDGTRGKYYTHDKARFMIGAMLAADRPTEAQGDNKQMNVGDALARFCSSNGPAWVKFGQALSNLPMLPSDIREPMSVLKDKAVSKNRWELLAEVRENMSPESQNNVRRFGKMLGAGSFWETVSVEMTDGSKQVLQMMAPGAKRNADSEFAKIVRTIEDLSAQNVQYAVLDRIVKRAKESAEVETNIAKGYDQYVAAKKNYEAFDRIEVNGVTFEMQLMPWTDFNQDTKSGNGYKMMEMADGRGLAKLDCTPEEKKVLAAGYVATELGILLAGKSWDIDRHGGQQNFDIKRDKDGKIEKVVVGIYDTGALRPPPSEEEKTMIANFYAAVIKASIKGDNVTEVMFDEVKKLEDKGINATYVSDVQRGCIAINDLVEYQKAGVDKTGKTVEAQSFGQSDFIKLFGAILASGAIDKRIADTLLEKLVTDKSVYVALTKEMVKSGVQKVKRVFTHNQPNNDESLHVVLETRGCLRTKEHNRAIDEANPLQSANNVFNEIKHVPVNKKDMSRSTKIARNLQAFMLKKLRRNNAK